MELYDVRLYLIGVTNPTVWRRLLLDPDMTFHDFAHVIMGQFNFENMHLHAFRLKNQRYFEIGDPKNADSFWGEPKDFIDENKIRLRNALPGCPKSLYFHYDFGDDWKIGITFRGIKEGEMPPDGWERLTSGGAAPVEDCGGIYSFMRMREIIAQGKDAVDADDWEWATRFLGEHFDATDPYWSPFY